MKKLVVEIPEWAEGARIVVLAGIESIAEYNPVVDPDYMKVKITRCARCGACCQDCEYLKKGKCTMDRNSRPLNCSYDPERKPVGCSITHKMVKVE